MGKSCPIPKALKEDDKLRALDRGCEVGAVGEELDVDAASKSDLASIDHGPRPPRGLIEAASDRCAENSSIPGRSTQGGSVAVIHRRWLVDKHMVTLRKRCEGC